jgi:hypothetical protein
MKHAAVLALVTAACTTTQVFIPESDRPALQRQLVGEDRFLKVSCYSTPFFGDATKKLLTPVEPGQVRLLDNPDGSPIEPGATELTFPAGTLVRIKQVEFPSAFTMAERVLVTPRTLVWLYLDLAGTPKGSPPFILVLRPGLNDATQLQSEVERFLTRENPAPRLAAFSDSVREAVLSKKAVLDMPAEALEMAWGYPESKRVTYDGERKQETWTWPGGKRFALLVDGRVTELH